jgi:hypothetical protein
VKRGSEACSNFNFLAPWFSLPLSCPDALFHFECNMWYAWESSIQRSGMPRR